MAEPRFPFLPTCCQPLAEFLERENRTGTLNCPRGHMVSLTYARMIDADLKRKSARAAAPAAPAAAAK